MIHRLFSRSSCERGNVALLFGFAAPVLIGLSGLALDGASMNRQHTWMQNAADSVSLAVAKELHLYREKPEELKSVALARLDALVLDANYASNPHNIEVAVNTEEGSVAITFAMVHRALLPVSVAGENPVRVTSKARAYGQAKLCVLGLNRLADKTIETDKAAVLSAPECAVQSNSKDKSGLVVEGGSQIVSAATCSSGGIDGAESITPDPETDCTPLDDPLEGRPPPPLGGCDLLDMLLDKGETTLSPGTYCGGMKLKNDAVVTLNPGTYVILGGNIDMGNNTTLRGENVSFYFADDLSTFDFRDKGLIELSAPKEGPMAGILFYGNRLSLLHRTFRISSDSARKLLGTIYLPNSSLEITGAGDVAQESAYTIIIADKIQICELRLVMNANYSETDVPVPEGLGPNSGQITLEQ